MTMWFCAAFIFLTFPCASWLLFSEEVDSLMTAVLYSMFLFGLVIPPMGGLVMDSVPAHQKPHASAVYGFLTDALGFMLAPSLIGVATDWWGIAVGWRWGFPLRFSVRGSCSPPSEWIRSSSTTTPTALMNTTGRTVFKTSKRAVRMASIAIAIDLTLARCQSVAERCFLRYCSSMGPLG